ncbi:hypothetical protein M0R45_008491 [Rubus argutus]|uniref:Ubiquitin-like protease family profile domain-containing protein n=1 Tax=Rubus argutus TaxID=59490 RepID=A0AAW1Y270_RUBAR
MNSKVTLWSCSLEAKIDARDAGKVAPHETQCVDNPHVSGHGSCSQTADVGTDDGLVKEPVNHVDGKSVKKVLEDMEQNLLRNRKGSKTVRQKVDKTIFKPQHENEVMKMAKKANSNVEEKVVVDELEGDQEKENGKESAKPNCVQEHEEIEYVDLTTRGDKSKTYIIGTDVRRLASMREITANCIVVYLRYLYDVLTRYKMRDMIAFVDPALIGGKGCGNGIVRSQNIKERLITAKPGQLFMLPYNSDSHWMLTVVDPDKETVYFMDPMKRRLATGEWTGIVDSAIGMYNSHKGRKGRSSVNWKNLAGIPPQPSDKECGWERRGNLRYSQENIDEVRNEWAKFVVNTYV